MAEKSDEKTKNGEDGVEVSGTFFLLLMLGLAAVVVGVVLVLVASLLGGGSSSVGGVIFIGPLPLVFGAGPDAAWLITISVVISVVMILVFVFMRRRNYRV